MLLASRWVRTIQRIAQRIYMLYYVPVDQLAEVQYILYCIMREALKRLHPEVASQE